ncbi:MAG: phospholipid carrier-dependent glycosyltransferase [Desulfobulbaceae bacterium]|nr:phospholipid carrier-dependent glycosyltransferase [Desulfobulbaceae bacterium]
MMEARNLVAAREIVDNNDWLIPTMNGEIRLAKPPLPTWFAALVTRAAGGTDDLSLLRIPNAISATLLVLFLYGFCWTLSKDRLMAFMAAAMLGSNILLFEVGHKASWDIFCHTFMLAALWAFLYAIREKGTLSVFVVIGVFLGLSFMSKGPVSFFSLFLPFAAGYFWVYKGSGMKKRWPQLVFSLVLCLIISAAWPLYIAIYHPEALLAVTQQESGAWVNRHVQPFWYYWNFPLFSTVWLTFTLAALVKPYAEKRTGISVSDYRFLLVWFGIAILLLSAIPEKKPRYLLPALIPLAMLGGSFLRGLADVFKKGTQVRADEVLLFLHTLLTSVFAVLLPGTLFYFLRFQNGGGSTFFFIVAGLVYGAIAAAAWRVYRKRNVVGLSLLSLFLLLFTFFTYMYSYRDLIFANPEYKTMSQAALAVLPEDVVLYQMEGGVINMVHVWELNRHIREWRSDEVLSLLRQEKPVAVISKGDPAAFLSKKMNAEVEIEVVDRFDYKKSKPQKEKIFLSRISLKK